MSKNTYTDYKNQYQRDNYDRIAVQVPKGERDRLRTWALANGYKSLNDFIVKSIYEKIDTSDH